MVSAIGFAVYLFGGLLLNTLTVRSQAGVAESELQAFKASVTAGDMPAAARHLDRGRHAVDAARGAAHSGPLRALGLVPALAPTYGDLDHLLDAADEVTTAGEDALDIYDSFTGDDVFANSTVDLSAVRDARRSVRAISASLDDAAASLLRVHGRGPLGSKAIAKRDSASAQVVALQKQVATASPVVNALPSVLGATTPKTYLVAVMNPAEMRASGGAPLSVAFIHFDKGRLTIPLKGTTSELTNLNEKTVWTKLPGDPWQPDGPQRFVNTNFNPSFPVSAQQMIRAAPSNFRGIQVDGVVALDVVAIQHMLQATGPINIADYGTLDASNVAQKLVIDAYTTSEAAAVTARHDVNDQLMTIMLSRFTEGGALISKAKALQQAVPGRHLQVYLADRQLERLVLDKNAGGAVPASPTGNLSAVYTQNTNQSKMDVFQQRTVDETVQLRKDGSALVRRTVTLVNASPPFVGVAPDKKIGYETRWAGSQVINLMPKGARLVSSPAASAAGAKVSVEGVSSGADQDGRTFAQARVLLPPDARTSLTWSYVVPAAATRSGSGLVLTDAVAPQSMLTSPTLNLTVLPPKGWAVTPSAGWTQQGTGATVSTPMDHAQTLTVAAAPTP